jgi:hypothetical protein
LYGKFYNKRPVATGLDRFFLRCGPIRTGPKWSGYGPLISGSVYTGCGCQLPRFEVKNRTRLDFKTLLTSAFHPRKSTTSPTLNTWEDPSFMNCNSGLRTRIFWRDLKPYTCMGCLVHENHTFLLHLHITLFMKETMSFTSRLI